MKRKDLFYLKEMRIRTLVKKQNVTQRDKCICEHTPTSEKRARSKCENIAKTHGLISAKMSIISSNCQ